VAYFRQDFAEWGDRSVLEETMAGAEALHALGSELAQLEGRLGDVDAPDYDRVLDRYSEVEASYSALGGYTIEPRARSLLAGLGFSDAEVDGILQGAQAHRVNQLALAAIGAFASGLVAGALRLTADYVANRHQFGKPLSTFQTVAAQLAEVYITSRTLTLAATSVVWRLAEGRDADDDLDVLGYWLASQAPPVMQICHHLHGGMGMDIDYPMDRYYSTIKDLTRLVGGPSHRLDLVGAQCSSN